MNALFFHCGNCRGCAHTHGETSWVCRYFHSAPERDADEQDRWGERRLCSIEADPKLLEPPPWCKWRHVRAVEKKQDTPNDPPPSDDLQKLARDTADAVAKDYALAYYPEHLRTRILSALHDVAKAKDTEIARLVKEISRIDNLRLEAENLCANCHNAHVEEIATLTAENAAMREVLNHIAVPFAGMDRERMIEDARAALAPRSDAQKGEPDAGQV
jgi:hypothetical protein